MNAVHKSKTRSVWPSLLGLLVVLLTVKHYFFRRILISRFPYIENSLCFNLVDFPVNFGASNKCYCRNSSYCLHYITPIILHIVPWKCWYSMQINSWWSSIPKICVHLILRRVKYTSLLAWPVYSVFVSPECTCYLCVSPTFWNSRVCILYNSVNNLLVTKTRMQEGYYELHMLQRASVHI